LATLDTPREKAAAAEAGGFPDLEALGSFLLQNADSATPEQIDEWLKARLDKTVKEYVNSPEFAELKDQVLDALERAVAPPEGWDETRFVRVRVDGLRAARVVGLLEALASKDPPLSVDDVFYLVRYAPVVLPHIQVPATQLRPPLLADLKVVRVGHPRYEPGAIAHIENVMKSELRAREIRILHQLETTTQTTTERTRETEQELQTNNTVALQQQTSSTLQQSTQLEAGLEITASYGPTVQARVDARAASQSSREDASLSAAQYATEVTRKARERIVERAQEVRTVRELLETEEKNEHKFDNTTGDKNIQGVYRWVDSIQDCWIENYGLRLMLDLVIPEPAAVLKWARSNLGTGEKIPNPPAPPTIAAGGVDTPLEPSLIDEDNYSVLVGHWGATNVPRPPAPSVELGLAWKGESADVDTYVYGSDDSKLKVPKNYRATGWAAHCVTWGDAGDDAATLLLSVGGYGNIQQGPKEELKKEYAGNLDFYEDTVIPVALLGRGMLQIAIDLRVHCELTTAGKAEWQHKVFDAVWAAYQKQLEAWRIAKAQAEERARAELTYGQGVAGGNPEENRGIERRELRRSVIHMLLGQSSLEGVFADKAVTTEGGGPPTFDLAVAAKEREPMLFFEQGLDWRNMSWVLYPYYWQDAAAWSAAAAQEPGAKKEKMNK